jgi:type IV pilus assembly protein PilP
MTNLRIILAIGAVVSLLSCGDEAPPPAAAAPAAPKAPAAPAAPVAAAAATDGGTVSEPVIYTYSYNPVGKRDPFRSPIDEMKNKKEEDKSQEGICAEPLCQFDLEQLTLVAVVSGDANPVAMLEDTTRVGHIVRRNSKVGKQGGKVSQILRDCIEVTEFFLSPDGKKVPNRVSICVKKDDRLERAFDLFNNKAAE